MPKRIIRVFPRRTNATPDDNLVYINKAPDLFAEADEIHISVVFSWDLPIANKLEKLWKYVAPLMIGGPGTGQRSEDFVPGKYVKLGRTITSRGCPNKCWFCSVWKREGPIRELSVIAGYNIMDDNLLSCSDKHVRSVFTMLRGQKEKIKFTGGLEAARLKDWHIDEFTKLHLHSMFFAYDTPDDLEPLQEAGRKLVRAGIIESGNSIARCFVLIGYPKDTYGRADQRLQDVMKAGFVPYIMIYRDNEKGRANPAWGRFKKRWVGDSAVVVMSTCIENRKELIRSVKGDN